MEILSFLAYSQLDLFYCNYGTLYLDLSHHYHYGQISQDRML